MADETAVLIFEAPLCSELYVQALRLREAILRKPLGLTVTHEELFDDAMRQHFCAVSYGAVVGTVSLRPRDETTLHLKQMAVARRGGSSGSGRNSWPMPKAGRRKPASASWCSMRGSAPKASI
jgi:hypothetical protein